MNWKYFVETIPGNFHQAVHHINEKHPDWDVVTMEFVGNYTLVVRRKKIMNTGITIEGEDE